MTFGYVFLAALMIAGIAAGQGETKSQYRCDMTALSKAERSRIQVLHKEILASVTEKRELPNGYAYRIPTDRTSLLRVAEWMDLERKCCPFFQFQLEVKPENGPVFLHLTGGEGIKEFIRAEMGMK